ncbi:hypothetical protein GGI16_003350, partial [Coemansia sp. S142-1]
MKRLNTDQDVLSEIAFFEYTVFSHDVLGALIAILTCFDLSLGVEDNNNVYHTIGCTI